MYARECLYDVNWQDIRVKMLGSWTTPSNCLLNIAELSKYCEQGNDRWERYTRCTNYFAAILLGFGSKPDFAESARVVKSAHNAFSGLLAQHKPSATEWNWAKVEADLKLAPKPMLKAIQDNLKRRIYTSTKRTGGTQFRPELMKFYGYLSEQLK